MTEPTVVRRLTAIMFTDVVGYSKLMAADEQRALELMHRQRELFTPLIAVHNGTLHTEIGDGTLSSFGSVVDALRCARAIQAALSALGPDEKFEIRIGLHIGDVVFEGSDVFGDGVNVASRIEALAPPGGIALSGPFYGAVRGQRDLTVHSLGEKMLKNIEQPVTVFVLGESVAKRGRSKSFPFLVGAAVVVIVLVFVAYRYGSDQVPAPTQENQSAPRQQQPIAAIDKSIAVLPFVNMSSDKEQEYFSDGMSEELLNLLAQAPDLKVIARTSSFAFKGKNVPIAEIAKQLNVAHVLEGSVRKSGNTVRITAQLIRTADSTHLWSETYDRPLDDIFKVQDEIAGAIAQALQIRMAGGTLSRREGGTPNLEAYQLYLRGSSELYKNTKASLDAAGDDLEKAIKRDPSYGMAWLGLANVVELKTDNGYLSATEGYERMRQLAQHALQLSPNLAGAHAALQFIHVTFDWDWAAAETEGQRALALDPTNPWALNAAGMLARTLGHWKDSERQLREALTRDPLNPFVIWNLGFTYYMAGKLEESEGMYRKVLELEPGFLWTRGYLSRTLLAEGKPQAALEMVQQDSDESNRLFYLPIVLQAAGRQAEADEAVKAQIAEHADTSPYFVALSYAYRGDRDLAMQWLERAYKQRDQALVEIVGEPLLKNIADDPRFKAFLRKMKLPEERMGGQL